MSDLLKRRISRRNMMRGAAVGAATAALSACQPKVVEVTREVEKVVKEVVKETVVVGGTPEVVEKEVTRVIEAEVQPQGEKVVRYMTQIWNWQKLNMATATDEYNRQMRGKVRIEADPNPEGWQTKVAQMVKDGKLEWNGMLRTRNLGEIRDYNRMGIIEPWDEFINSSSVPWAGKFWDELLPNIRTSFSEEGKLFGFPWDIEVFCRVYRKDFWDKMGTTPAATLPDFEAQLYELKEMFPDNVPMSFRHWCTHPDQHMLMQLWTDNPWVQEPEGSYLDVRGDAYKEMMTLLKNWYDDGIITDDTWGETVAIESWNKGISLTIQSNASWTQAQARKVWGTPNIATTTNFVLKEGDKPKTFTFGNGAILFKGATEPQEVTDWLLWMVDPTVEKIENYSFHLGYLNYFHFPAYKSVYEKIIPSNADWAWMQPLYEMINNSAPVPTDAHLDIFGPIADAWEQKFMHGECTLDECINAIYEEERAQVRKIMEGKL